MPKKHYLSIATACLLGAMGLSSVAMAGTEVASTGKETKTVTPPCPVSYITGDFGVTFVSEYISRGVILQTKGVIAQPYLDLYFKFYDGGDTGFINSMSAQLSLWSDVGSNSAAATNSSARDWFEFDWDPGVSIVFAKSFTLTTSYFEFDSPAGVAGYPARSVNANLAYDDSGILGAFALHPHFTVLYELGAPGLAGLGAKGWYYELGVAPSYTFLKSSKYPITFTLPVTVGLGDSRFYYNNKFGYVAVGATLAVPLAFIPAGYGSWTLTGGYTYYHLDDALTEFRAPDTNGKADQHVFSGAIGCTF